MSEKIYPGQKDYIMKTFYYPDENVHQDKKVRIDCLKCERKQFAECNNCKRMACLDHFNEDARLCSDCEEEA